MIDASLISILCCPETHQALRIATDEELKAFSEDLKAALIREDGLAVYPVQGGIPMIVPEAAIFRRA